MTKSCSAQWNCPHTTDDLILNHVIKPVDKSSVNTLPLIETKFILVHFKELTIHKFYLFLPASAELKSKSLHMHVAAEMLQQAVPHCSARELAVLGLWEPRLLHQSPWPPENWVSHGSPSYKDLPPHAWEAAGPLLPDSAPKTHQSTFLWYPSLY